MSETLQSYPAGDFGLSMSAAASLCGWSERTLWRKLAGGQLRRHDAQGSRTSLAWSSLLPHLCISPDEKTLALLRKADAGCALSQAELALHWISQGQVACALHWLKLAAQAEQPDAMYTLGRAYLCGDGLTADRNLGLMWLARAAAAKHLIADAVLLALSHPVLSQSGLLPMALRAA